jgi:hypothetical protein
MEECGDAQRDLADPPPPTRSAIRTRHPTQLFGFVNIIRSSSILLPLLI